ncbi:MAG TPA: PHP domain-containing protein, partial [Candidatus Paceibacterota bacterium]
MPRFVPLNVHSHYSLLSALPKIPELVARAKREGHAALALTDNGNLYGALEFYKECKKEGIKPIVGMHAYLALRSRTDKQTGVDNRRDRLILLARNLEGYHNLIRLTTAAHLEGFYYKPRVDRELLERHSAGLIAIAPAFGSDIRRLLQQKEDDALAERVGWYRKTFGADSFFLEVSRHREIDGHDEGVRELAAFARVHNLQLVASQEVYYLTPDEKLARETLLRVSTQGEAAERDADESDFSFPPSETFETRFADLPDALDASRRIADRCNLELTLGKWIFPDYRTESGASHDDELRAMASAGLARRKMEKTAEVETRLEYELSVIKTKGYAPYFLVVADLLRYAHEHGILTTIRGSVAGSLVTYLAGITNVNPLEYRLPFERFLNPERPSAPDIDMDFADNRRDEMIEYAKKKYGADKVAQIGT